MDLARIAKRVLCAVLVCLLAMGELIPLYTIADSNADNSKISDFQNANDDTVFAEYWKSYSSKEKPIQRYVLDGGENRPSKGDYSVRNVDNDTVIELNKNSFAEWEFAAEEGLYRISFEYMALEGQDSAVECSIELGGSAPFREAKNIKLNKVWKDAQKTTDNRGNELSPPQIIAETFNTSVLNGVDNISAESYYFYLKDGLNTIRVTSVNEKFYLKKVIIYNPEKLPSYEEYLQQKKNFPNDVSGVQIKIEAENAVYKSSSNLYPMSDRSTPNVSPSSPVNGLLNFIGGSGWAYTSQWIEWEVNVPENGFYTIGAKYKQNFIRGLQVGRRMTIDGKVYFEEMNDIRFNYSDSWKFVQLGGKDEPYKFYLEAGTHKIRLECVLGNMTELLTELNRVLTELNQLYRRIIMITGVTPDPYNDYFLHKEIPELMDTFERSGNTLKSIAGKLESEYGTMGSAASSLYDIARQLESFRKKPNTIPQRLDSYKSNLSVLAELVLSLKQQPLQLDLMVLASEDQKPAEKSSNILQVAAFRFRSFIASFSSDYGSLGNRYGSEKNPLNVWISANDLLATGVSSGRDQASILKRFIDEQFTPATGIPVNLSLVSTSDTLIQAVAGHKAPDVAIFVPKALPISLAIRGALDDLSKSPKFPEWEKRVYDSAFIPYRYKDGVYGMPETQIFNVLFYRRDILNELNLTPPETWEDFYKSVVIIQGKKLQVGIPSDQTTFEMLLLQNGKSIYNDDMSRIALSDSDSISVFRMWTELYSQYGIPLQYDFFNRFRTGEMPMAIAPLTMYNQLTIAAPEIYNLWDIAPIPATVRNGEYNRSQGCVTTASIVMQSSNNKASAYDFLDWWTSDDVQAQFGNSMENLLGASARYNTANKNAFERLPWEEDEKEVLRLLLKDVSDIPQSPASYYINRNILNAFRRVLYYNENPREVINKYSQDMNRELIRKRKEFGLEQ